MKSSFKNYGIFLLIAMLVGAVLLSNKAGINLRHHHSLPQLTQAEKIYCEGFYYKTCHVRLATEIGKPEQYRELFHLISTAKSGDTVYIHLIGNGGLVSTTVQFYNVIKASKAKIVTVVEGDVYSAHAYIAMMGHKIMIADYVLLLVHNSSAYGSVETICIDKQGEEDRTHDAYEKCVGYFNMHLLQSDNIMTKLFSKVLTAKEMEKAKKGHDVIITGEQARQRLGAKK
jgi:ATP-dependent protease ClpP protease subunit